MRMYLNMLGVGFFLSLLFFSVADAAQSTADVPVSAEMKESALKEVLGDRPESMVREDAYVLGHGDVVTVSIFEEGDMAVSAASATAGRDGETGDAPRVAGSGIRVMMDGRISLREIGDVEVVGLTLTELADYLKKLYSVIYENPIVTTTLVQSNSLRYTVMGEVAKSGVFFLDYPLSLVQVVARCGGFSEWANREITVIRQQLKSGDEKLFSGNKLDFDYDDFLAGKQLEKNVMIRSGDIIVIH